MTIAAPDSSLSAKRRRQQPIDAGDPGSDTARGRDLKSNAEKGTLETVVIGASLFLFRVSAKVTDETIQRIGL
jgi:hypothetical protein